MANKQPLGSDFDTPYYWTHISPVLDRVDTGEMWTRIADERWRAQLVRALIAQQWAVFTSLVAAVVDTVNEGEDAAEDCGPGLMCSAGYLGSMPSPVEMAAMILGEE